MARLKEIYKKEVIPALTAQFGYKSEMQVPRLKKIVLNMGVGEAIAESGIARDELYVTTKLNNGFHEPDAARRAFDEGPWPRMKALTFQGEGDVKVTDVPKPAIKASGDALVKVTLGAVCGSDLHILHGHTPINQGAVLAFGKPQEIIYNEAVRKVYLGENFRL